MRTIEDIQLPDVQTPRRLSRSTPKIRGKFLFEDTEKLWVKGVTYGTFRPVHGKEEFNRTTVERDFRLMEKNFINAIRIYTVPPRWLLDVAHLNGIRVFVTFPWGEHITFLDNASTARSIRQRLSASVRELGDHPALLCYAVGNEIPAPIVRWHGAKKIERYLLSLYETAKEQNPSLLVSYVNYPSTEYLQLPFLDLVCFNVFLESHTKFRSYVQRLQNIAGDKPLLLTEVGLDSRRNGFEKQARLIRSQIWQSFRMGCAGLFVFSWTDEWYRGGTDIADWDFGLTTRNRHPKPALDLVRKQFSKTPFRAGTWPKISVVICTYNGSKTIDQCLQSLLKLDYPDYEVIVIDDGSTDETASIAAKYPVRLIRTVNHGLSAARNRAMTEATAEIIAYLDDDAYVDPHWLRYLATAFQETNHQCIGGPNVVPPEDGFIAQCVAHSPGGPIHVLLTDEEAEHVPGCNMAIKKTTLQSIGGFDPQFRAAGDDVDVCWRLQNAGYTIGFHPGALVWHHRRNSISSYFRQQRGYGKAEVLLARKWPEKYNAVGHTTWAGRVYQNVSLATGRIYHGMWGTSPFQSVYLRSNRFFADVLLMPEWILLILFFCFLTGVGFHWTILNFCAAVLFLTILLPIQNGLRSALAIPGATDASALKRYKTTLVCTFLHCIQPMARFAGRWPVWRPNYRRFVFPKTRRISVWSECWQAPAEKLSRILEKCKRQGAIVATGGPFDTWDLESKGGSFGMARLLMVVEEHGQGKQMSRFRIQAHSPWLWPLLVACILVLAGMATLYSWFSASVLFLFSILLSARILIEAGRAMSALVSSIEHFEKNPTDSHSPQYE
jgi:GT2 family glycosyltransferase